MVCQTKDGMGKGITLVDGHCICVLVTRVRDNARGFSQRHTGTAPPEWPHT